MMDYTGVRWRAIDLFATRSIVGRKDPIRATPPSVKDLLRENADLRHELTRLEAYRTLAYRDELTGLWNRRYFTERLTEELSRARRQPRRHFGIMMVDVNDLKAINDAHGHAEGDLVLRWVAEFLERLLRTHDVLCRVGGDEFAVLFPRDRGDRIRTAAHATAGSRSPRPAPALRSPSASALGSPTIPRMAPPATSSCT